ncbi:MULTISPECIES: hypothetical protein [unclassified Sphingomonas]|jgi:hypothetical protein|nr:MULTISPECIES: hypothetical protein [unclassified Sphingomonas]
MTNPIHFLRAVLTIDAITCLGMGALLAAAAGPLAGLFDLPAVLLFEAGLLLFPSAAFMLWAARQADRLEWPVRAIALLNLGWTAASFAVIALLAPNPLGAAFIVLQALAVAGLAALEFHGLSLFRRAFA